MRYSDKHIKEFLDKKIIEITPKPDHNLISGATIDLKLGNVFRTFNQYSVPYIDLGANKEVLSQQLDKIMSEEIVIEDEKSFILHPGELTLGHTFENVKIPKNMIAWLDGRSSLARLGLMVHVTAHRIDPGWDGKIVLEFFNIGKIPLGLKPGMIIGALSFEALSSDAEQSYIDKKTAKYKYQDSAISSRISQDND